RRRRPSSWVLTCCARTTTASRRRRTGSWWRVRASECSWHRTIHGTPTTHTRRPTRPDGGDERVRKLQSGNESVKRARGDATRLEAEDEAHHAVFDDRGGELIGEGHHLGVDAHEVAGPRVAALDHRGDDLGHLRRLAHE